MLFSVCWIDWMFLYLSILLPLLVIAFSGILLKQGAENRVRKIQ